MARGFSSAPGASADIAAAAAPGLTKERLTELGGSRNALVREVVAGRDDCPFGLMVTLAHDHVADVRMAIAANPRALRSILEYLARDRHPGVAGAVVANPTVPREVLEYLAVHRRAEVRRAAAAALDGWDESARSTAPALPELRDRVFEETVARREAASAQAASAAVIDHAVAQPGPGADTARDAGTAPRTRTAPVRGFRPPAQA